MSAGVAGFSSLIDSQGPETQREGTSPEVHREPSLSQRRLRKKKVQSVETSNSSTNDSVDILKAILLRLEQLTKGVDDLRDETSLMKGSIDVLRDDLSLVKRSIDDTKAYLPSAEGSMIKCASEKDVSILTDIVSSIVDAGQSKKSALVAK